MCRIVNGTSDVASRLKTRDEQVEENAKIERDYAKIEKKTEASPGCKNMGILPRDSFCLFTIST
jgi:hypothetical protein